MSIRAGGIFWFSLFAMGALAYFGVFYTTGSQWYEGCYELQVEQRKAGFAQPQTSDPYKAIFWNNCEIISERGIYETGIIFSGNSDFDYGAKEMGNSCPSNWSDTPLSGIYALTINLIKEQNAPSILDRVQPAEWMIGRLFKQRWPRCASERVRLGYPKIIEKPAGKFDWEVPCKRCVTDHIQQR